MSIYADVSDLSPWHIYVGITNDMERREAEHRADGMQFASMRKVGNITTPEAASDWETARIHTYQKNHGGDTPQYNKNNQFFTSLYLASQRVSCSIPLTSSFLHLPSQWQYLR